MGSWAKARFLFQPHINAVLPWKCAEEKTLSFLQLGCVLFHLYHMCNSQAPQTFSAVDCCRNKDRATHPITSVKLSTSRQTCVYNINTSDPHYSSQEQLDFRYEIGWQCLWWVFASKTAQRNLKLTQFADGVLSKATDILCVSVTVLRYDFVCVWGGGLLRKHWGSCKWRECMSSYNRCTILWLQGDVQKDDWNCLLSILNEFQYCEMRWEVQLRDNFLYWTQQGNKTERHGGLHRHTGFYVHTPTHTIFFGSCQT